MGNIGKIVEKNDGGMHGVKCYGIVSAENANSQSQSATLCKRLPDTLKSAHYPFVHQGGNSDGNNEYSYFVFNIPLEVMMYYSGEFEQTSFIYCATQEDGTVLYECWEKTDITRPYDKVKNPYIKKEEETSRIKCSIPFSMFESVYRGIKENCIKNKQPYSVTFL